LFRIITLIQKNCNFSLAQLFDEWFEGIEPVLSESSVAFPGRMDFGKEHGSIQERGIVIDQDESLFDGHFPDSGIDLNMDPLLGMFSEREGAIFRNRRDHRDKALRGFSRAGLEFFEYFDDIFHVG